MGLLQNSKPVGAANRRLYGKAYLQQPHFFHIFRPNASWLLIFNPLQRLPEAPFQQNTHAGNGPVYVAPHIGVEPFQQDSGDGALIKQGQVADILLRNIPAVRCRTSRSIRSSETL